MASNWLRKKEKKKSGVAESLEERARIILAGSEFTLRDSAIPSELEREIALTLEHIDGVRNLHNDLRGRLSRLERYVDTDMLQLEPRPQDRVDWHRNERNSLKRRLEWIEEQRLKLSKEEAAKLEELHKKLLSLLERLTVLRG
jgi:hypothetical protein